MSDAQKIAQELVNGINEQKTRKGKPLVTTNTLCDFGILGLLTPIDLVETLQVKNGATK